MDKKELIEFLKEALSISVYRDDEIGEKKINIDIELEGEVISQDRASLD